MDPHLDLKEKTLYKKEMLNLELDATLGCLLWEIYGHQILKDDAMKVLHSICQQIWKTAVATGLEKVSFHSNPKERQCQRMLKLLHNSTHLTC